MVKLEDVRICRDLHTCGWWGSKDELRQDTSMCPVCRGYVQSLDRIIEERKSLDRWEELLQLAARAIDNDEKWVPKKGSWAESLVSEPKLR